MTGTMLKTLVQRAGNAQRKGHNATVAQYKQLAVSQRLCSAAAFDKLIVRFLRAR